MSTYAQAQQQNARKIASLGEPEMRALLKVLQEARTDTARGLASWLKKIPREKRDQKYTIHAHRALLGELDTALSRIRKRLAPAVRKDLLGETRGAMIESLQQLEKMIKASQRKFSDSVQPLRLDLVQQVMRSGELLVDRHERSAERYAGRQGEVMRHELAVGLVRGESVDQIARRLSGKLDRVYSKMKDDDVGDAYGERGFFRSRYDAERLVRTELIHAANTVQSDALEEDDKQREDRGNDSDDQWMKKWDSAMDAQSCDFCDDMDGQVVPASEMFHSDEYGDVDGPPLHPNCRCSVLPWRESWAS